MLGKELAMKAAEHKEFGIELDITGTAEPSVKDYFAPLLPWELFGFQGQTHNGKTFFVDWFERETAKFLATKGQQGDIVHISHEESIEAISF